VPYLGRDLIIEIEGDYITPQNALNWQQQTIPGLLHLTESLLTYAKDSIQIEVIKQLLRELALISELCSKSQETSSEIPVVYEGFHLTHDETSVVIELMNTLIDMIQKSGTDTIEDDYIAISITSLKTTQRKLALVSQSPKLWEESMVAFQKACNNTIKSVV